MNTVLLRIQEKKSSILEYSNSYTEVALSRYRGPANFAGCVCKFFGSVRLQ